ncbi:hypothetical protein H4R33_001113 [Dimargaris cristalligena]|uniref:Endoribonuclease L-PSP n=1 Tax=Dimargaris cristalligena TaxID=215637 RepID=A0A4Q0A291_9FUNG|nr:hypothetical protein H4R33_001113 [Dimargaris cristalligena]RKP40184.1 endoribonuclease L-PSP [Dimargaris cristalligena]|eukprot:RKP40184.1 endoribonuclease L-PSP [Dimargaris cristalligena]
MSPKIQSVISRDVARPLGPYCHAVIANGQVYTSGQLGFTAASQFAGSDIRSQTRQAFTNIQAVLQTAGSDLDYVLKTSVFLQDMDDFDGMNEVYAEIFGDHRPARSAFQVSRLPKDGLVEIETIALLK